MKRLVARVITFLALFLLILMVTPVDKVQATSIATGEFFACDASGDLFRVNTVTGAATLIGNMGVMMTDIAFSPSGELFGVTFTDLYSIDPNTAASTLLGSLGINDTNALEFGPDGTLFLASRNSTRLRTVNTTTGATTVVGDMGVASSGDLAFDPSSEHLFLSALPVRNNDLYQVDPNTAASTLVGPIGFQDVFGLDFNVSGSTLFGLTNGGELITIDTTTGAGTLVANTGVAAFGASAPAKEREGIVEVRVGYLNNVGGAPDPDEIPPFDAGPDTIVISSGGVRTRHDTGVLRFENVGNVFVTIDLVRVVTELGCFRIWDDPEREIPDPTTHPGTCSRPLPNQAPHLPITLAPGQKLVLAETENFNFDTSDFGLGLTPVVIFTVDGMQFTCLDIERVLLGHDDATGPAETTRFKLLGVADASHLTPNCLQFPPSPPEEKMAGR